MGFREGSGLGGCNREARKIVGIESDGQSYTPISNLVQAPRILARLVLIQGGRQ
jgi:hypothetical protein